MENGCETANLQRSIIQAYTRRPWISVELYKGSVRSFRAALTRPCNKPCLSHIGLRPSPRSSDRLAPVLNHTILAGHSAALADVKPAMSFGHLHVRLDARRRLVCTPKLLHRGQNVRYSGDSNPCWPIASTRARSRRSRAGQSNHRPGNTLDLMTPSLPTGRGT